MSDDTPAPPRPVVGLGSAQTGDVAVGNVAGRDTHRHGLTGDEARQLLEGQREFALTLVAAYERMHKDLSQQIRNVGHDVDLRFAIDESDRQKRQSKLDDEIAALRALLADVRRAQHSYRLWLFAVSVVVFLVELWALFLR